MKAAYLAMVVCLVGVAYMLAQLAMQLCDVVQLAALPMAFGG